MPTLPRIATGMYSVDRLQDLWRSILNVSLGKQTFELVSVPNSATASGAAGQVAVDATYIYVCTETNTWKRASLSTW